jgi:uncharacterized membrane protein YcaP (DUF421 family)
MRLNFIDIYLISWSWAFDGWNSIWRTLLIGVFAYLSLVALLRVSGKRTLSKLNAFDLVITVAFGSTLASALTSQQVSLAQCVTAFALLVILQFIFTWLAVRSNRIQSLIKASPTMLFYKGEFLYNIMKKERVTEEELRAVVRENGSASMEDIAAIVMETDGSFSVIQKIQNGEYGSLRNLDEKFNTVKQDYKIPQVNEKGKP